MIQEFDGRTLSGMRHQIDVLCGNPLTKTEGLELRDHKETIELCAVIRKPALAHCDFDELELTAKTIAKRLHPKDWPAECRYGSLGKYCSKYVNDADCAKIMDALEPFVVSEFEFCNPRIGAYQDATEASKLSTVSRIFFKEILVEALGKGTSAAALVIRMSALVITRYDSFDVFDNSELAVATTTSWMNAAKFLLTLADPSIGAKYAELFVFSLCLFIIVYLCLSFLFCFYVYFKFV